MLNESLNKEQNSDLMTDPTRKPRPDSLLSNLPSDQQQRILDWLSAHSYRAVLEKIAAPAPEGLGLKVHYTSLRRFRQRRIASHLCAQRAEASALETHSQKTASHPSPYPALTREALERYCFHLALNPQQNPELMIKLNRILLWLRQQDITTKKFAWEVEARETEIARQQKAASPEERQEEFDKRCERIFGTRPIGSLAKRHTQEACSRPGACSEPGKSEAPVTFDHDLTRRNSQIAP
jgi:hypothetical protein